MLAEIRKLLDDKALYALPPDERADLRELRIGVRSSGGPQLAQLLARSASGSASSALSSSSARISASTASLAGWSSRHRVQVRAHVADHPLRAPARRHRARAARATISGTCASRSAAM